MSFEKLADAMTRALRSGRVSLDSLPVLKELGYVPGAGAANRGALSGYRDYMRIHALTDNPRYARAAARNYTLGPAFATSPEEYRAAVASLDAGRPTSLSELLLRRPGDVPVYFAPRTYTLNSETNLAGNYGAPSVVRLGTARLPADAVRPIQGAPAHPADSLDLFRELDRRDPHGFQLMTLRHEQGEHAPPTAVHATHMSTAPIHAERRVALRSPLLQAARYEQRRAHPEDRLQEAIFRAVGGGGGILEPSAKRWRGGYQQYEKRMRLRTKQNDPNAGPVLAHAQTLRDLWRKAGYRSRPTVASPEDIARLLAVPEASTSLLAPADRLDRLRWNDLYRKATQ